MYIAAIDNVNYLSYSSIVVRDATSLFREGLTSQYVG